MAFKISPFWLEVWIGIEGAASFLWMSDWMKYAQFYYTIIINKKKINICYRHVQRCEMSLRGFLLIISDCSQRLPIRCDVVFLTISKPALLFNDGKSSILPHISSNFNHYIILIVFSNSELKTVLICSEEPGPG